MIEKIQKSTAITSEQWHSAMNSNERIEKINTHKGVYWLKKSTPARGIFRYYALNFFSFVLRAPLLKAVPQNGGQEALNKESDRIKSLSKNGVTVPEIIAESEGWLLLKDLGVSIINQMKSERKNQALIRHLFTICIDGIKHLHMNGNYMSQGFVRNILQIKNTDKVGFIDFEDDPLDVLSLEQAQARDLLLFVNSTARFFVNDKEFFNQQVQHFMDGHNPIVVENIRLTNKKLLWITKLPFQKALGHDYQKLKLGILALNTN